MTSEKSKPYKPYIHFKPGYDYDWVKEVNSEEFVLHPQFSKDPKVALGARPVKLSKVKQIIADALARPEIVEAFTAYLIEMTDKEYAVFFNTKLFFNEYLKYKYGNIECYGMFTPHLITQIASKEWTGFNDPELQKYLGKYIEWGGLIKDVEYE